MRFVKFVVPCVAILLFQACVSFPVSKDLQRSDVGAQTQGSPVDSVEKVQSHQTDCSVILVLGPSGARSFAYVGILRALQEEQIPIHSIYVTGMGSLLATLYAISDHQNEWEWKLQKLKMDVFQTPKSFFEKMSQHFVSPERRVYNYLKNLLGDLTFDQTKVPVKITFYSKKDRRFLLLTAGSLLDAVYESLIDSDISWSSDTVPSMEYIREAYSFLISQAKQHSDHPLVGVHVLDESSFSRGLEILKGADRIIEPDMKNIGWTDFNQKTEAAYRGRKATEDFLKVFKKKMNCFLSESFRK